MALAAGRNGNGQLQATPERVWNPLFFNFEKTDEFSLSVGQDNGKTSVLTMRKVPDENVSLDINNGTVTGIFKQGYAPQDLDNHFLLWSTLIPEIIIRLVGNSPLKIPRSDMCLFLEIKRRMKRLL